MRIAIIGAGALGGLFACLLKRGGQDVTLIERSRQDVSAIRRRGLTLVNGDGEETHYEVPITLAVLLKDPVDLLLYTVKSYDTREAVECTLHMVGEETFVGSFQNGLGNLEIMAEYIGRDRLFCGSLAHSAMNMSRSRIRYTGGTGGLGLGKLDDEFVDGFQRVVEAFETTGLPVKTHEHCETLLWNKLVMNAGANALSAVVGRTCEELLADPELRQIMGLAVTEAVAVATRKGLSINGADNPVEPLFRALEGIGANKTSMLVDIEQGRPIEIGSINDKIVEEGIRLGVDTPVNRLLSLLVRSHHRQGAVGSPGLK